MKLESGTAKSQINQLKFKTPGASGWASGLPKAKREKVATTSQKTAKQDKIITIRKDNPAMTNQQIADAVKTSPGYVADVLIKYGLNKESIDDYNSNKATIWHGISARLLSKLTDEQIQKASALQLVTAAGIAFDKASLLDGINPDSKPLVIINSLTVNQPVKQDSDQVIDVQVEG